MATIQPWTNGLSPSLQWVIADVPGRSGYVCSSPRNGQFGLWSTRPIRSRRRAYSQERTDEVAIHRPLIPISRGKLATPKHAAVPISCAKVVIPLYVAQTFRYGMRPLPASHRVTKQLMARPRLTKIGPFCLTSPYHNDRRPAPSTAILKQGRQRRRGTICPIARRVSLDTASLAAEGKSLG